ncbi:DoxX family membrane protein [Spirosoma sp. KUDC1026]|uniref:DoxX family membrane protein n=1 Tax=Spirosoma sp. KUDC1026 TaxID=2745947 RepID=UPI00159BA83F|nr:DoxX family membrane protein [Spirosoma sp. KUDC1026]QKZ15360.1 DoxX family membrane protein [Spirosoma sp. KUDC1026]
MNFSPNQLAQLVIRLGIGINMLMHGLTRLPKLNGFVAKMAPGFAETILPAAITRGFLFALPFIEIATGLLILLGGRTIKWGYFLGGLIISALLFGTTLKQDWAGAATQMIYLIAFYLALRGLEPVERNR